MSKKSTPHRETKASPTEAAIPTEDPSLEEAYPGEDEDEEEDEVEDEDLDEEDEDEEEEEADVE